MPAASSDDEIERFARSAARFLNLVIREEDWPSVLANVRTLQSVANDLLAQPIPDDVEAGPVFKA
jgi:hypothetical protein